MSNDTKYLLAAHIGGTKARLGLVKTNSHQQNKPEWVYKNRFSIGNYSDPLPLFQQFLKEAEPVLRSPIKLEKACIAVAGPVENNRCEMTNGDLIIDGNSLADKLSINPGNLKLINDFQSVTYGITQLEPKDIQTLKEGKIIEKKPIAVIGPATGLGKTLLVQSDDNITYTAYPTEGGHTNFAPRSPLQFALLLYILHNVKGENNEPLKRVSVERVLSGRGIVAIYRFLKDCQNDPDKSHWLQGLPVKVKDEIKKVKGKLQSIKKEVGTKNLKDYPLSPLDKEKILQIYQDKPLNIFLEEIEKILSEGLKNKSDMERELEMKKKQKILDKFSEQQQIEKLITIWWREDERCRETLDPAAVIASAALKKNDPLCIYTMKIFLQIYGAELANSALLFLPDGGLYMAGGITPQILPLIEEEKTEILAAFETLDFSMKDKGEDKRLLREKLKNIHLYVLKNIEAGLIGAAYYAEHKM